MAVLVGPSLFRSCSMDPRQASMVEGGVEAACPKHHIELVVVVIVVLVVECIVGAAMVVQVGWLWLR